MRVVLQPTDCMTVCIVVWCENPAWLNTGPTRVCGPTRGGPMGSRFRILGRTQLLVGDHFDDQWATPKVRGMLAALLVNPGRTVSTDELTDWVWPADAEKPQPSTFHTYAKRIRDALRLMADPPRLVPDRGAYRIEVDQNDVDIHEFHNLVYRARLLSEQGDHATARDTLQSAMDLWSDRPLADMDGDRARDWRTAVVDDHWLPAQSELMRELSALGEFADVLRRLAELPAEHQTNPLIVKRRLEALFGLRQRQGRHRLLPAHAQAVAGRLHAGRGRRSHAASTKRCSAGPSRPPANRPTVAALLTGPAPPVPHLLPHDIPDLAGRDDLLDQLDAVTAPAAAVTVLSGQPGVGKTALAVRWAHRAADRYPGRPVLRRSRWRWRRSDGGGGHRRRPLPRRTGLPRGADADAPRHGRLEAAQPAVRPPRAGRARRRRVHQTRAPADRLPTLPRTVVTSRKLLSGLDRRGATNLTCAAVAPPRLHTVARRSCRRAGTARTRRGDRARGPLRRQRTRAARRGQPHPADDPRISLAEFVTELRDMTALLELGDDADNPGGSVRADVRHGLPVDWIRPSAGCSRCSASTQGPTSPSKRPRRWPAWTSGPSGAVLDSLVDAHLLTQPEVRGRYRFHDLMRHFAGLVRDVRRIPRGNAGGRATNAELLPPRRPQGR